MRFTKDHEWVVVEGDVATVGITAYAAEQLGDVVFVETPEVGKTVSQGDSGNSRLKAHRIAPTHSRPRNVQNVTSLARTSDGSQNSSVAGPCRGPSCTVIGQLPAARAVASSNHSASWVKRGRERSKRKFNGNDREERASTPPF